MSVAEFDRSSAVASRPARLPNINGLLLRPRVVALLEAAAAAPVCIVSGPRGCGKTVVLQQWSSETSRNIAWLTLEDRATTADQLFQLLHLALGTPSHAGLSRRTVVDVAEDPIRQLADCLRGSEPTTLIVDNYQPERHPGGWRELARLLALAPELSLIVATRSAVDSAQRQAWCSLDVEAIDAGCLAFSDAEAAQFHAGTAVESIGAELNQEFQGLPALHKTAQRCARRPVPPNAALTKHILGQVAQILTREGSTAAKLWLGAGTVRLLAATLLLEGFDEELARAVVPGVDVRAALLALEEIGVLSSAIAASGIRYSYLPLLREVYTDVLSSDIAACRRQVLAAATALEFSRKEYLLAFNYAIANQDYETGTTILLKSGMRQLFVSSPFLLRTLQQVPSAQMVKHPLLAVTLGIIHSRDTRTRLRGLEYFGLALTDAPTYGKTGPVELRLASVLAQSVALRLSGSFTLAAAVSRRGLRDLSELPLPDRDQLQVFESVALGQWGLALLHIGDFAPATKALYNAFAVSAAVGSLESMYYANSLLAYRYAIDGDLRTAAGYAESAVRLVPDLPAILGHHQAPLNLALALIALGQLHPDAAETHLAKVIREAPTSEFWGQMCIIQAHIDLLKGRAGAASGQLELALQLKLEHPALNPGDAIGLKVLQAHLLMATGKASGASAALERASLRGSAAAEISRARLSLALGRPQDVVESLGSGLKFTTTLQRVESQAILTVARLHLLPPDVVRADVEKLAGSLETLNNLWPLSLLPASSLRLLRETVEAQHIPFPDLAGLPTGSLPSALSMIALTPRERSILDTLARTADRAEIARLHFVSLNTVKSQLRSLYKKLGVSSREEALLVANQEKLLGH
ncbi:helix-turn-helix transcriptional regulator [Arthrobacter sp. HLT1-20]